MPGFVDPYADPTIGILRNLAGAATQDDLDQIEADVVQSRTVDLPQQRIKPTRDLIELRAIRRYLFQDVYDWAGDLRTVDIRKNADRCSRGYLVGFPTGTRDATPDHQARLRGLRRRPGRDHLESSRRSAGSHPRQNCHRDGADLLRSGVIRF